MVTVIAGTKNYTLFHPSQAGSLHMSPDFRIRTNFLLFLPPEFRGGVLREEVQCCW